MNKWDHIQNIVIILVSGLVVWKVSLWGLVFLLFVAYEGPTNQRNHQSKVNMQSDLHRKIEKILEMFDIKYDPKKCIREWNLMGHLVNLVDKECTKAVKEARWRVNNFKLK